MFIVDNTSTSLSEYKQDCSDEVSKEQEEDYLVPVYPIFEHVYQDLVYKDADTSGELIIINNYESLTPVKTTLGKCKTSQLQSFSSTGWDALL